MEPLLLLDTDVLVEFLRGRPRAAEFLESIEGPVAVSAVSVAELFAGARGRKDGGCSSSTVR